MSKKILIVDDEPDFLELIGDLLKDHGYHVVEAFDGAEGLKRAAEEKPDLVCLDLLMPRKTGIELYRDMKKDPALKTIPVIIVSGFVFPNLDHDSYKTFIHPRAMPAPEAYIEKPVDEDQFLQTVRDVLGQ